MSKLSADKNRGKSGNAAGELALYEAAIASMPCGFSLWDENLDLVLFNQNYLDMYQFKSKKVGKGISLREVTEIRIEEGSLEKVDPEEAYQSIRDEFFDHQDPYNPIFVEKQVLGRIIRIAVARHPGVGWVVTHEDITQASERVEIAKARKKDLVLQNARFEAAVENMAHGLAMYDADESLVICNRKYRELYQLPDALSQPGTSFHEIIDCIMQTGLVPKGCVDGGTSTFVKTLKSAASSVVINEMENGKVYSVVDELTDEGGWVSIHQDVTEERAHIDAARAREEELTLQNARFEAAVGSMAHGLAMFDADEKLVICNKPYLEIFNLSPEMGRPGTPFQDILDYRSSLPSAPLVKDQGDLPHKVKELAMQMSAGGAPVRQIWEMQNGQHVSSTYAPSGDGGWVSIHEDGTQERQRLKAAKIREAELKVQNSRFNAAVGNMAHGLAMFDVNENLVICNQPYLEIYKLPADFGRPGTSFKSMMVYRETMGATPKDFSQQAVANSLTDLVKDLKVGCEPVTKIWEMRNGMHVAVSYGPMEDGGWVSTHEDVTVRQLKEEHIRHLSRHDDLTGLPNRSYFSQEMNKAESRIARGEMMAVLCLDLDRFKDVNDTLGHGIGDEVLKQVAARLKNAVRDHETVARMGGDEFMCLIGPLEHPRQASLVAKRILFEFSKPMSVEGHQIKIGTSIGVAVAPADGTDGDTLMRNADRALYRAKDEGKGCFHFFEKSMDDDIHKRQSMEDDLKSAMQLEQFSLTFQPILELGSNRISSCEAMINWDHPRLGRLLSKDFVQLAQEIGVNDNLIHWTIEQACQAATNWPSQVRLSLNLSTFQIGKKGLVAAIDRVLKKTGLDPARLELGVSEAHLDKRTASTTKILHKLKALGVRLSLDEFGKETSSLNRLKVFSFDKINLDPSFVADNAANQENREIAKAVVNLGCSLGIVMNAVGVDKECQLDFMRDLGCHEVQGYLFSAPLPSCSISELLHTVELRAAEELGIRLPTMPLDKVMDL
ncbi:MAG: PAS-domain containing protein [Devosiaceae bacterium]|nr:PAS-domain containing protein [Devosiaceae bacterium]